MALTDWSILKSDLTIKAALTQIAPIAGGSSLFLSDNGAPGNPQAVLLRSLSSEKGLLFGKLSGLFRLDQVNGAGVGFVFMMDRENITGDFGQFYGLFVGKTRIAATEIVLSKFLHGLQGAETLLAFSSYVPSGVCALEVEWRSDLGNIGGTRIIIRSSDPTIDAIDYNNLTTVYDQVDSTSPFVITHAEGIAYHNVLGGANSFIVDKTIMMKVT